MNEKEKAPIAGASSNLSANIFPDAKLQNFSENTKFSDENIWKGVESMIEDVEKLTPTTKIASSVTKMPSTDISFFVVKSARDTMAEQSTQEPPRPLWQTLWYEGQLCCLFANSGVGKSLYAVQMGVAIAAKRKVLYFDFELSASQFFVRYSDGMGHFYNFPENFFRVEINPDYLAELGMGNVMREIERTTLAHNCDTIIIDNLTWVASSVENAEDAGKLMQQFMRLKKLYGWSILIIAHTPKRDKQQPITENDLAGSKVLFNFLDSAFSIGQSQRGDNYRYIIEIKTRMGTKTYGKNNVILTNIIKENNFTYHEAIGYSTEADELRTQSGRKNNDELVSIFLPIMGAGKMRYTDLVAEVANNATKTNGDTIRERSAKNYIKSAFNMGILQKDADGKYSLSAMVQK